MKTIEFAGVLGGLRSSLEAKGLTVREVDDVSTVPQLVQKIGKPYLTPLSSPLHNDFTERNALWLVAERDGEPVYLGCARLEDIGSESIGRYWSRVLRRAYGAENQEPVIQDVRPEVERALGGKLVYFGDLYVGAPARGVREDLRAFVAIGHLAASLKWDPDFVYCFIREEDMMRGAMQRYGFRASFSNPFHWISPPHPRDNSEWLVTLPRGEILESAMSALWAATREAEARAAKIVQLDHQQRKVQDPDVSVAVGDG